MKRCGILTLMLHLFFLFRLINRFRKFILSNCFSLHLFSGTFALHFFSLNPTQLIDMEKQVKYPICFEECRLLRGDFSEVLDEYFKNITPKELESYLIDLYSDAIHGAKEKPTEEVSNRLHMMMTNLNFVKKLHKLYKEEESKLLQNCRLLLLLVSIF